MGCVCVFVCDCCRDRDTPMLVKVGTTNHLVRRDRVAQIAIRRYIPESQRCPRIPRQPSGVRTGARTGVSLGFADVRVVTMSIFLTLADI
jgi:hypothetical protein